jgi:hypothetical protein
MRKLLLVWQILPINSDEEYDDYGQVRDIFSFIRKLYLQTFYC